MFRRKRKQEDFNAEIDAHLQLETELLEEEGLRKDEARMAARRTFGNVTRAQERFYESGRWLILEHLVQDLRFGLRQLRKNPGFTAVAVLTLAIGIGANTAVFSTIYAVLLRPLPYGNPDRLVIVWSDHHLKGGPAHEWTNPADFYDWREQSKTLEDMAFFGQWAPTLTGTGEPEILKGMRLSYSMFAVLGVKPEVGRDFTAEDDRPNANHVAIVAHALCENKYGHDVAALGRQLNLDGVEYTIVGVMPAGFSSPIIPNREIWSPLQAPSRGRGNAVLRVIGRLRSGTTLAAAQTEMTGIGERLAEAYPETNKKLGIALVPLQEQISGDVRPPLLVLLTAVGLVLLIGCSNVANLLLARGTSRQTEISLRIALGAGRGRILRQLLTESCVLALIGGAAGLLLAQWAMRFLAASLPPSVTSVAPVRLDSPVLLFTLAISLVTGIAFGLLPAVHVSRARIGEVLRSSGRSSTAGKGRYRLRIVLVGADIALALALMTGAGLLLKSFLQLTRVNLGFRPDHLLSVNLFLPRTGYPESQHVMGFYAQLLEKLSALPGVIAATAVSDPPLGIGGSDASFLIEGRPVASPADMPVAWYEQVPPNYHRVMGIPLMQGRAFDDRDTATAPKVILINQSMAQRFWPDQNPIGKRIGQGGRGETEWYEIVGVVGNIKFFGLDKEQPPCFYMPLAQVPQRAMTVMLRTAGPPLSLASACTVGCVVAGPQPGGS